MSDWTDYDWHDVTPDNVPEIPGHVAQIAYSEEFKNVMGKFRACSANREMSPRMLALTKAIIELNPAHYSVWDYRFEVAKAIGHKVYDYKVVGLTPKAPAPPAIGEDGDWLNQFTLSHAKNYQVWNYRQHLIDPENPLWFHGERVLAMMVFEDDSKNFHAWSHLKWVVLQSKHLKSSAFSDGSSLLADCDRMLNDDVWNNSVWSFRYFLLAQFPNLLDIPKELEFIRQCASLAPSNESVWSYLRGFATILAPSAVEDARLIASEYSSAQPRAIEFLAEISEEDTAKELWLKLCELEPIRRPFWESRMASFA